MRIIRGVRIALPEGIGPASVYIEDGKIVALAGYEEVPREAIPEELGKSLLMPALTMSAPVGKAPPPIGNWEKIALATGVTSTIADAKSALPILEADALARQWTQMRDRGVLIGKALRKFAEQQGETWEMKEGATADLVVWNPELVLVDSSPLLYGPVRQTIVAGVTRFKNGQWSLPE